VILWHFNTVPVPGLWRIDYGNLGVRVFFVISGFLITTLLLENGSLKQFYARRFARIMPAYWVFLAAVALAIPKVKASYSDIAPSFFYLTDYLRVGLTLGATWSLSVEEQFYLLWPTVLLLGRRKATWACVGVLVAAPFFRVLAHAHLWPTDPRYAFECVSDALATGCLLALLREELWRLPLYRRFLPYAPYAPLAVLAWLALVPWGISALNLSIAFAMDRLMREPSRLLNSWPAVGVGTLSYSLYLWQQVFIGGLPFAVKVSATFACACASYYLIEKPARRWLNSLPLAQDQRSTRQSRSTL
jgi:peptidoglycan/LPS O-acetylase OafA/YrhL